MSTAVADRPADSAAQHAAGAQGAPSDSSPRGDASPAAAHACANCGTPLAAGQDWCLQCGAGAPGSLSSRTPSWRSAAVIVTALVVLVAGAATAAYAALNKNSSAPPAATTIAQATPPAATTPTAPVTPTPSGTATAKIGTPTTIKPTPLPKPTKIPLTPTVTPTPKATTTPTVTPTPGVEGTKTPSTSTPKKSSEEVVGEAHPEALLLDTNAASTYNPYGYAASNFGDPSLAIDGDNTTAWTALVEPSVAPKLAEGIVIDLNTARKLSGAALSTETPGMTVQVYGSDAPTLPTSITDPAWVALTPSFIEKKRHVKIKFGHGSAAIVVAAKRPHRFITLWISQAPAAAVGSPEAPGHVAVNEFELFPLKKK